MPQNRSEQYIQKDITKIQAIGIVLSGVFELQGLRCGVMAVSRLCALADTGRCWNKIEPVKLKLW